MNQQTASTTSALGQTPIRTYGPKSVLITAAICFAVGYLGYLTSERMKQPSEQLDEVASVFEQAIDIALPKAAPPSATDFAESPGRKAEIHDHPNPENDQVPGERKGNPYADVAHEAPKSMPATAASITEEKTPRPSASTDDSPEPASQPVTLLEEVRLRAARSDPPPQFLKFGAGSDEQLSLFTPRSVRGLTGECHFRAGKVTREDGYPIREEFTIAWPKNDGSVFVQRGYRTFDHFGETSMVRLEYWSQVETMQTVREAYRIAKDIRPRW